MQLDCISGSVIARLKELYPARRYWKTRGWSTPRWRGTGEEPHYRIYDGATAFDISSTTKYFPKSIRIPSEPFLFDGQYFYINISMDSTSLESLFPIARTPQKWRNDWHTVWDEVKNGFFCFLPNFTSQLWNHRLSESKYDPDVVELLSSNNGHCGANLSATELEDAPLASTDLSEVKLRGSNLKNANLSNACLTGAILRRANLDGANLQNADLTEAKLEAINKSPTSLVDTNLSYATLCNARFDRANLRHCRLIGVDAEGTKFTGSKLDFAQLHNGNFCNASFHHAHLKKASTTDYVKGKPRFGAKFRNANFSHSRLSGADLRNSDFTGAVFTGASFDPLQRVVQKNNSEGEIEIHVANLDKAIFDWARLENVHFKNVNLLYIDTLNNAVLINCHFEGTKIKQGQFDNHNNTSVLALSASFLRSSICHLPVASVLPQWLRSENLDKRTSYEGSPYTLPMFEVIQSAISIKWWPTPFDVIQRFCYLFVSPACVEVAVWWNRAARDTLVSIKQLYIDSSYAIDSSSMAFGEKEMERQLNYLELIWSLFMLTRSLRGWFSVRFNTLRDLAVMYNSIRKWLNSWVAAAEESQRTSKQVLNPSLTSVIRDEGSFTTESGAVRFSPPTTYHVDTGSKIKLLPKLWDYWVATFMRRVVGYGERPNNVAVTAAWSIIIFAILFLYWGTPVQISVTEHVTYSFKYFIEEEPTLDYLGWASLQSLILSIENFSGLGFYWISQDRYTGQNFLAGIECLWGVFLMTLFVWSYGRRMVAR